MLKGELMLRKYYPYECVPNVYRIDYKKLYNNGYRGLIFDIDMTLVPHGDDATEKVERLFDYVHNIGFKTFILSDNDEQRVKRFLKNIECPYIANANKPCVDAFNKAVKMMELKKSEVVMIGDQMFYDILGANKSNIASIMVHYLPHPGETQVPKRRRVERAILRIYHADKKAYKRLGDICLKKEKGQNDTKDVKNNAKERKLFCDICPATYFISTEKEILKRHIKNMMNNDVLAKEKKDYKLLNLVSEHSNILIKTGPGIDPVLQENKAVNIDIACKKINGLIIHPGETFSFWRTVGNTTKSKGYKDGRVIIGNKVIPGIGGGLCNLSNTIHCLVEHSPLEVTEFHTHSDALAPDHGERVPLSSGTSVSYNYIDFCFKNTTSQDVQLCLWCEDGKLMGELRSEYEFPYVYEITEEGHHFHRENGKLYRISKIYKVTKNRNDGEVVDKKLIWDNHSEVMFDYSLIPEDQIQ